MRQSRQRTPALRRGLCLGVATCALLTGLPVAAAGLLDRAPAVPAAAPDTLAPIEVRDLHYGDVLFEFYNGDLPNALLKLRVYEAQGLLRHHADDAKLLLGGLYFSQGQHLEAGRLFAEVLDRPGVPPTVRDRAPLRRRTGRVRAVPLSARRVMERGRASLNSPPALLE